MKNETHISIEVSIESIRDSLRKKIISEHSQLIADVIIGNLKNTECGTEQLFKALNGIGDTPKYKVGDDVLVDMNALYTWQFDKDATEKLAIKGKIKAKILSIDLFKRSSYEVSFKACQIKDSELKEFTSMVNEARICLEEEWPFDSSDDLPF